MLFNERIEGVLEIASFQALEDYQIELIEKLGESLAASVASVKNAGRTTELLAELQEQTEMLRAQEEEMRQNMEELTITQEQMRIKQNELESLKANLEIEVQSRTRQLSESLIRLDLINKISSEGLWDMVVPEDEILRPETPFSWSPQLKSNLGYGDSDFPNRLSSWMAILHPEDQERVFRQFVNFIKDRSGQFSFLNEHRLKVKTGEYRWFRAYCQVLRENESGKALRVAGYINDITHQRELDEALSTLQIQKETLQAQSQAMEAQNQKLKNNEQVLQKALLRNREKEMLRINKELAEKEERFHFMTANIPGVIYQSETNTKEKTSSYTFISDYIAQVLGYLPEEFLAFGREKIIQILHPSERDAFFEQYYESMVSMKPYAWEGRMRHQKGKWVWVKAQASPRHKGDTIIFDGILFDITEQHEQQNKLYQINQQLSKSEEELRQNLFNLHKTQQEMEEKQKDLASINRKLGDNEQILKKALLKLRERESTIERRNEEITAILNASTDAILTINAQGIVQSANQVVETMFGFSTQEIIGQNISCLMASPDAGQHDASIERYLSTQEARILGKTRHVKAQRKNGEAFDAIISVSEIKLKNQHFFTGFIRDLAQEAFIIAEINPQQNKPGKKN
ncbi:MAG: PAS domain-containing protein [Microscillaceae bacterium]|nr:PAS domain-containing protein [Microscillaceae bacterium]